MMKVSFDLQLDIQRAIRQEVAAGIAAATGTFHMYSPNYVGMSIQLILFLVSVKIFGMNCFFGWHDQIKC